MAKDRFTNTISFPGMVRRLVESGCYDVEGLGKFTFSANGGLQFEVEPVLLERIQEYRVENIQAAKANALARVDSLEKENVKLRSRVFELKTEVQVLRKVDSELVEEASQPDAEFNKLSDDKLSDELNAASVRYLALVAEKKNRRGERR